MFMALGKHQLYCVAICSATLFACNALAGNPTPPFTAISGSGETYVFSQIGAWNKPVCVESHTSTFGLDELGKGTSDDALCYFTDSFAGARVNVLQTVTAAGFEMNIDSEGLIYDENSIGTFSRHDSDGQFVFDSTSTRRVRIDLTMSASGLGSLTIDYRRIGDAGGGGGGSMTYVDESLSAYIDPVTSEHLWVFDMPAGRWRVNYYSTHQCTSSTEGFEESIADLNFSITVVSNADVNGNGIVNTEDLLAVIGSWGVCGSCSEDLDGDGVVGVEDLLLVVGNWG